MGQLHGGSLTMCDEIEYTGRCREYAARKATKRAYREAVRQAVGPWWVHIVCILMLCWPMGLLVKAWYHAPH